MQGLGLRLDLNVGLDPLCWALSVRTFWQVFLAEALALNGQLPEAGKVSVFVRVRVRVCT